MSYNGGCLIGMRGKNCVAIASDRRFGVQALGLTTEFQKIFPVNDKICYGLAGLGTDVQTLSEKFTFKTNMYKLNEEREIGVKTFAHLVSSTLYEKRFGPYYAEPVIVGIEKDGKPFICSMDLIGCINFAEDFVVTGTASEQLYGMCEALWEPELEAEDLFETISQAMLSATNRDALSGWGGVVTVITPDKIITRTLKGRSD
ncbi:proteasome core particle subunit beta 3 [Nowakowskiella sp. JEL0078]|nr:proteasome core particle subunit beta 3 [Nowakowskiella sp. JEL0078]